jgi:hypothetical protein
MGAERRLREQLSRMYEKRYDVLNEERSLRFGLGKGDRFDVQPNIQDAGGV